MLKLAQLNPIGLKSQHDDTSQKTNLKTNPKVEVRATFTCVVIIDSHRRRSKKKGSRWKDYLDLRSRRRAPFPDLLLLSLSSSPTLTNS